MEGHSQCPPTVCRRGGNGAQTAVASGPVTTRHLPAAPAICPPVKEQKMLPRFSVLTWVTVAERLFYTYMIA